MRFTNYRGRSRNLPGCSCVFAPIAKFSRPRGKKLISANESMFVVRATNELAATIGLDVSEDAHRDSRRSAGPRRFKIVNAAVTSWQVADWPRSVVATAAIEATPPAYLKMNFVTVRSIVLPTGALYALFDARALSNKP